MNIDEIFETSLFKELKDYLIANSIYNPQVVKKYTQESKVFPIVTMILTESSYNYQTLSYGEDTEPFEIEINVYSTDIGDASKRTVCNEITNHIVDFWKNNYKVQLTVKKDFGNIDVTVHRNYIKITGVLDTKYGVDHLVIYPTLKNSRSYWY